MSHFTLEYSGNLDGDLDIDAVVELVRKAAVETGLFPLGAIRVRAIRCEHFSIADGRDGLAFVAVLLRLDEARDPVARRRAGDHIFRALSDYLDPLFAEDTFALSFDIQINATDTSWQRNSIHDLLINEARHG